MEDKRKYSAETPPRPPLQPVATSTDVPASEQPSSSRRRGGGLKRKSASVNSSGVSGSSTSTPLTNSSKRQAREKPPAIPFPSIHTNGPCTRARVHPLNNSSAASSKREVEALDSVSKGKDSNRMDEDLDALEAKIEAEYEATRLRDANVHVVPIHAGWFMWKKIHPLEERMLPSFFNGKSESRNPEMYMEIRNAIMKKFHHNPNEQIEAKHLSELTIGELDARQEVMEFLEFWGLVNYHPFPLKEPVAIPVEADANKGEATKVNSLVDKLFQFETVQSWTPSTPRMNLEFPAMPSGLFPESVAIDELVKSEGPSVEYHCNSCSADCSRKRYHCQKQADFDLCADCFNDGKFGSDMVPSDFILMEPAEATGTSGGNWTDQETLLLLEAIELFRDNWTEIAEHVATKTKAQCILHFVQMPIEDAFFKHEDTSNDAPKESAVPISINTEDSVVKADPDGDTSVGQIGTMQDCGVTENSNADEINESIDSPDVGETLVLKALKEAFEAVGSIPSPGERVSFANAGNPVMTLTSFLARLADRNAVTASVHSLQNFMSGYFSSVELAARHCFTLEAPPDDNVEIYPSVTIQRELQEDGGSHAEKYEKDPDFVALKTSSFHAESSVKKDFSMADHRKTDSAVEEKKPQSSSRRNHAKKTSARRWLKGIANRQEAQQAPENERSNLEIPNGQLVKDTKKAVSTPLSEPQVTALGKSENASSAGYTSQSKVPLRDEAAISFSGKNDVDIPAKGNSSTEKDITGEREANDTKSSSTLVRKNGVDIKKLKRAAVSALAGAAVKAKLLADQEEDQILGLSAFLIEKQLYKVETKLAFLHDIDNIVVRVKEQIDNIKVRLYHERAQIIASRMGSRTNTSSQGLPPTNRTTVNFPNPGVRPFMGTKPLLSPLSRPMLPMNPTSFGKQVPQ